MESTVLLCCLNPSEASTNITNEQLASLFAQEQEIADVLIFSREVQVKAFVEFKTPEAAQHVLSALNGKVTEFGKFKLYVSKKDAIRRREAQLTDKNHTPKDTSIVSADRDYKDRSSPFTLNLKNSFKPKNMLQSNPSIEEGLPQGSMQKPQQLDSGRINTTKSTSGPYSFYPTQLQGISQSPSKLRPNALDNIEALKVVIVNRINPKVVSCQILSNLFCCFGNVTKILLSKEPSYALVEFESSEQAVSAIEHLKHLSFFSHPLKLKLSKYTSLNFKALEAENNPSLQHFYVSPKAYRYKCGLAIKINPPSRILHFTSVSNNVDPVILFELLRQVHEPERIIQLARRGLNSKMFLVEFREVFHAIELLSVLHNKQVDDRNLKISFSHTKLY